MRSLFLGFTLIVVAITAPMVAAQRVELLTDASKTGAKIDRSIFGTVRRASRTRHLRRHLGRAYYVFKMYVPFQDAAFVPGDA